MPYVYLIGWTKTNMYYYGVRYSKYADSGDLWVTYKTSSVYVAQYVEENGPPDIIKIRKVFKQQKYEIAKESAMKWESKVLRRMNAVARSDFLNRWDNNMVPLNLEGPFPFENKDTQVKVDATLRLKYNGRGSASPDIKEKVEQTNLKKYGVPYTTQLEHVKEAREKSVKEKFGTDNPFKNKEKLHDIMLERHGVTNMMHDPEVKRKHAASMKSKDWTGRNNKSKQTNLEKYGVSNPMNRPGVQDKHKRACPFGCKDNHKFMAGNFTNHMKKIHGWTQEQIQEYKK